MASHGKVKGTLLVHLEGYALRNHGETTWRRMIVGLPGEDRKTLSEPLIVGLWYPVGVWNRALNAYLSNNFASPGRAMTSFAEYVAAEDLTTLFKLILKMGSPDFVLRRTDSLYNRYFDTGRWSAEKRSNRIWHCALNAPRAEDEGPGQLSCGEGISAWVRRALELTGTRARVEHARCRFHGGTACEYEITW